MRALKILRQFSRFPEVLACRRATPQWLQLSTAYLGLRKLGYPTTVRFRDGGSFPLEDFYDTATFWLVFFQHVYPVRSGDRVIVDAGGNIGSFSFYALRSAPRARVIAVEPFPESYRRMCQVIATNGLGDRFTPIQAALGATAGVSFVDDRDQPSQFRRVTGGAKQGVAVATKSIEQIFDENGLDQVDFLKMDIEGGEYPTLLSAPPTLLRRIERIGLEFHPCDPGSEFSAEALFKHLELADFERVSFREDGDGYGMAWFERRS